VLVLVLLLPLFVVDFYCLFVFGFFCNLLFFVLFAFRSFFQSFHLVLCFVLSFELLILLPTCLFKFLSFVLVLVDGLSLMLVLLLLLLLFVVTLFVKFGFFFCHPYNFFVVSFFCFCFCLFVVPSFHLFGYSNLFFFICFGFYVCWSVCCLCVFVCLKK